MNLPKEFSLANSPWECPRCKRMNAPFNLTCFCSPESKKSIYEQMINAFGTNPNAEVYNKKCTIVCL